MTESSIAIKVDADVHQGFSSKFWSRLPRPWKDMRPPTGITWPARVLGHQGYRSDIHTESGEHHDETPQDVVRGLLEPYEIDFAVLTGNAGLLGASVHPNYHYGINFAQAYNDWLIEEWLDVDQRLLGSIMVGLLDVPSAVREIHRIADHPQVVQVIMPANSSKLYGDKYYWPIYEAAAEHRLTVAIHTSGGTLIPPSVAGWPTTYLEAHSMIPAEYLNHMVSLVSQGAFEEFQGFRFVFIEGGVAIFAPMLWRLEKNWKAVRAEVPWLTRSPREYLGTQIFFSTQPIEEPEDPELLRRIFSDLKGERSILFATDWPHWDFDDPEAALRPLSQDLKARVLGGNATDLYDLRRFSKSTDK